MCCFEFTLSKIFFTETDFTLQKIKIDKSVRYVIKDGHSNSEQTPHISKERESKPNRRKKIVSNNKFHKTIKNSLEV